MKGHIRKRGKNSWTLIFDLGPDPKTGRRRQKWETVHDCGKREAQRALNSRLAEIRHGTYVEPTDILVEDFLSRWLKAWAKQHTSQRTYERYEEIVEKHLSPALGKVELAKLTAAGDSGVLLASARNRPTSGRWAVGAHGSASPPRFTPGAFTSGQMGRSEP